MDPVSKNRKQDLQDKNIQVAAVHLRTTALLTILRQASGDRSHRGWGKLLGYFDLDSQTLEIRESYGLMLPKTDERMRKEDVIDDALKKNLNQFSANYRQVGFFIFSEDNDIFTYSIVNYIINNEKFGPAKVFLHFSIAKSRLGKNPVTCYEISDKLNELLTSKRLETDKSYYELAEDHLADFDIRNDSLFREIPFELVGGAVFDRFVQTHPEALELVEGTGERAKFSGQVTQNLNESVHKHAVHIQNFIQNKKTQKKATLVNLFGSFERIRSTLAEKQEIIAEIDRKMNQIEQKIN
jgi:hypothetical protein